MSRLIGVALLGGLALLLQNDGILYNLTHDLQPEPKRLCKIGGPMQTGTYLAYQQDDVHYVLDAHIGNANDRMNSLRTLSALIDQGRAVQLPEKTQVKVLSNASVNLYGCPYKISKVEVMHGDLAKTVGWVEREDVIDSPLLALFQSMRAPKSHKAEQLPSAMPDQPDPISQAQFNSRKSQRRMQEMQQMQSDQQ